MAVWPAYVAVAYVALFAVAALTLSIWASRRGASRRCCVCGLYLVSSNRLNMGLEGTTPTATMAWGLHHHSHLYKSSVLPERAGVVLVLLWRLALLAFFVATMIYQGTLSAAKGGFEPEFFTFFTNWTWLVYGLYAVVAVAESLRGLRHVGSQKDYTRPFDGLDKVFSLLIATVPSSSLFLAAFYWAALYDPDDGVDYLNVAKHGISASLLLIEVAVSRIPFTSTWMIAPILYTVAYAVFFWIYWGASDDWVYDVLDWREPGNLVYYAVLPFLQLLAFFIMFGIAALRESVVRRRAKFSSAWPDTELASEAKAGDRAVAQAVELGEQPRTQTR